MVTSLRRALQVPRDVAVSEDGLLTIFNECCLEGEILTVLAVDPSTGEQSTLYSAPHDSGPPIIGMDVVLLPESSATSLQVTALTLLRLLARSQRGQVGSLSASPPGPQVRRH